MLPRTQVLKRIVKPGYGEVMVYEHELVNPFSTEMVRGGGRVMVARKKTV